jgi:DNA-binding MarR family transcriptional regulator
MTAQTSQPLNHGNALQAKNAAASAMSAGRAFGTLLRIATRAFLMAIQTHVAKYDLTLHQYFVLRELWDDPGINQRVLCARLNTYEPAMVATLGTMVSLGYVERTRNPRDRRHCHLELTAAGRALSRRIFRGIETINKRAVAGMNDEETTLLRSLLARAYANLLENAPGVKPRARAARVRL